MVTVTVALAALFSLVGGFLNRAIGRRWTIILASFLFALGSVLLASASTYVFLLIGRAVIGKFLQNLNINKIPREFSKKSPILFEIVCEFQK